MPRPGPARSSTSPPTERVLDVIELLAEGSTDGPLRLADVARRLDITPATAHAIVTTMCQRGWIDRDPLDKRLSIGPALELAATRAGAVRPLRTAARSAALELVGDLGHAASVTERVEGSLLVTLFGGAGAASDALPPDERVPDAAPFGPAFAAWDPEAGRRAWIDRGSLADPALAERLEQELDATRARGYSIERTPPGLIRTAQLISGLEEDPWSQPVRQAIDEALVEIATAGFEPGDHEQQRPITAISAPVFDRRRTVVLNVAVHPFRPLSPARIAAIADRLLAATGALNGGVGPTDEASSRAG